MNLMLPPPDATLAKMALAFLERSEIKGNEVRSFVTVLNWLTAMSQPETMPMPEADAEPPRPNKK